MPTFDLKNKTILVTGGGRGIGREIVRKLAGHGAQIIIVGRNQKDLDQVALVHPNQIIGMQADLSTLMKSTISFPKSTKATTIYQY